MKRVRRSKKNIRKFVEENVDVVAENMITVGESVR